MKIGIIGGGITGLSAAYELGKRGHKVALFEKEAELGGQAGTFVVGGERLERFYHHIFTSDVDIIQIIAELGLGERLLWLDSKVGFFHRGRIYDFVTPMELLKFKPLGVADRVRLGLVSLYLRRYGNWHAMERVTAKEWLTRYGGRRSYEVVWGPLLKNKFGESAHEIGMVWLWGKIHLRLASRRGEKESLGYLNGSFGLLIESLRERIIDAGGEIYTSSPVDRVVVEGERATGIQSAGREHPCDAVIATVPSPVFLEMVPHLPADYAGKLAGVRYQGAVALVLTMNRPLSHIYWLNISDASIPFVALIEHTNLVDPSIYGGKRIIYIANYLSKDSPLYSLSPDELLQEYLPHLRKINPEFEPGWVEGCYLFRDDAGQPIITTNYSSRIPEHATPISCLYLANTTQIYPEDRGMNYSVRLGRRVAGLVTAEG
ncbi:MAG TPA: NAD(P)/FAD-dependent oxidoreductase [Dehalococcoidia bacterium]|nr:NAD(P)/FAD-dependent oxidoreductase [Dehalococcoidia bacterium]